MRPRGRAQHTAREMKSWSGAVQSRSVRRHQRTLAFRRFAALLRPRGAGLGGLAAWSGLVRAPRVRPAPQSLRVHRALPAPASRASRASSPTTAIPNRNPRAPHGARAVIQAGTYRLDAALTPVELLDSRRCAARRDPLRRGHHVPPAAQLAREPRCARPSPGQKCAEVRAALGVGEEGAEGWFFPDTYRWLRRGGHRPAEARR